VSTGCSSRERSIGSTRASAPSLTVRRHPFSRFAHYGGDDGVDWLFVAGAEYRIDSRQRAFAQVLCQWRELHFGFVAEWIECEDCLALMTQLFNAGHLELPDAD